MSRMEDGVSFASFETVLPPWLSDRERMLSGPGLPMTLWSDWHYGEVVAPEDVDGINAYNPFIARQRVLRLVGQIIDLCFSGFAKPDYPGIVVCLGGDLISGDMGPEEITATNALPTSVVLLELQDILVDALRSLANRFGAVFVPCVAGNHGKMTRRTRFKQAAFHNHEWLLYTQLQRRLSHERRIFFQVPRGLDAHFTVYQQRFCLTHGDLLGGKVMDDGNGILGPLRRGEARLRRAQAQIGRAFDTLLMGHWHNYLPLAPHLIVNGSLKGYDEYAHLWLRAAYEPPQQALWFLHPRAGFTTQCALRLDDQAAGPQAIAANAASWFW